MRRGWAATVAALMLIFLTGTLVSVEETSAARVIKISGTFTAYDDGTVVDSATNLMWANRDNTSARITWEQARSYCQGYNAGSYTGWRMPTLSELATLCASSGYGAVISLSESAKSGVWASDRDGNNAGIFSFKSCEKGFIDYRGGYFALPVRNK